MDSELFYSVIASRYISLLLSRYNGFGLFISLLFFRCMSSLFFRNMYNEFQIVISLLISRCIRAYRYSVPDITRRLVRIYTVCFKYSDF